MKSVLTSYPTQPFIMRPFIYETFYLGSMEFSTYGNFSNSVIYDI